jgi:hypothetical protein
VKARPGSALELAVIGIADHRHNPDERICSSAEPASLWRARRKAAGFATGWSTRRR